MRALMLCALLVCLLGCGDATPTPTPDDNAPTPDATPTPDTSSDAVQHFGAAFTIEGEPTALAEALPQVDDLLEQPVKIAARVQTSCRKKGCWMTLDPVAEAQPMRVTFKDYGFFVPTVSDGADAVIEGTFVKEVMDQATRRHFAEDEGMAPEQIEAIVGEVEVINFIATGVDLRNIPEQPASN